MLTGVRIWHWERVCAELHTSSVSCRMLVDPFGNASSSGIDETAARLIVITPSCPADYSADYADTWDYLDRRLKEMVSLSQSLGFGI